MIRYLFTTSTSQFAARPSGGDRNSATKCKWGRGYGLSDQHGSANTIAVSPVLQGGLGAIDLADRGCSNFADPGIDLPMFGRLMFGHPMLGQQLERDWRQRSGRYGCTTVPRED